MTAAEAYELTTQGGTTDFARLIAVCESYGPYCLIGGLAVNCYVEPVYTLDANLVVIASNLEKLAAELKEQGFEIEEHPHSLNALPQGSQLRIQFTTDERYQAFLSEPRKARSWVSQSKSHPLKTSLKANSGPTATPPAASANARKTNSTSSVSPRLIRI